MLHSPITDHGSLVPITDPAPITDLSLPADCVAWMTAEGLPLSADAIPALRQRSTVQAMIALACLSGQTEDRARYTRLPAAACAPTTSRALEARARRPRVPASNEAGTPPVSPAPSDGLRDDWVVLYVCPENPKAPGSKRWHRFQNYRVGATIAEMRAAGLRGRDFENDSARGYVRLGPKEG